MNFTCIHCSQSLEIDDDLGGKSVQCPACGRFILVPMSELPHQAAATPPTTPVTQTTTAVAPANHIPQRINSAMVHVVDFSMPFWSMVVFMIKWAIAAIPAMLILGFAYLVIASMLIGGCAATMMNLH